MALVLTEDEVMLVDSAKKLFSRSAPVSAFRALRDSGEKARYAPALWTEMAEAGYAGLLLPEAQGGTGFGAIGAGLIAEQIGHVLAASPLISSALATEILLLAGNEAQTSLLAEIAAGELIVAFAIDEGRRHDPEHFALRACADADGDGYVLEGEKRFVVDGGIADKFIVAAITDAGPALFLADATTAGVTITQLSLVDSRNAADVKFSGVKLPASALIGKAGDAAPVIGRALDIGRALLAAELLGMAQEAFDRTIAYLKEREQFGVKIGSFQALQHRASRMYCSLELARGVVLKALRALDEQDPAASLLASLAKAVLTKTARDVLNEATQMHGGIGVTDDIDIGLFFKRVRVAGDTFGDDFFQKERLARLAWKI
jgi:alkylation response protein AidB-like acyl-CoA dehydrogenase